MAVFAIVPVKNLADSKKRLSAVFTPQERQMLTLAMLEDVLNSLNASSVDEVVVVGEAYQVQQTAEKLDASYFEVKGASLNPALEKATSHCIQNGAASILVLPADIPLVNAIDINRIIQLSKGGGSAIVVSPSQNWGTNALYQNPPGLIPSCFGPKSFLNHIREAYRKGVSVRIHFSPQLAADIDSVEDLKKMYHAGNGTVCWRVLGQIMLGSKIAMDFLSIKT